MSDWNEQKGIAIPYATPTESEGEKISDNFQRLRDEVPFYSASDPTVDDDSEAGFFAGSQWFNTTTQTVWVCTDATASAAAWKSLFKREAGSAVFCPEDDGAVEIDNLKLDGNTVSVTNTDGDLILSPNGTGAIQADSGGDSRGDGAVDLQTLRLNSTEVASGNRSVICGGMENTAAHSHAFVGGGLGNIANWIRSVVAGGEYNEALSTHSTISGGLRNVSNYVRQFIGGGQDNEVHGWGSTIAGGRENSIDSGSYSTIGGGQLNVIDDTAIVIAGGYENEATGIYSAIGGGRANVVSDAYSFVPGGFEALASLWGQMAHASGKFADAGDAQSCRFVLRKQTTSASLAVLGLDGAARRPTIPTDTTWAFQILVVARRTDADNESAAWEFKGCIDNNAGTTALVGSVAKTVIADDSGGIWDVSVIADDTSDYLRVEVTGEASKTIRWVATVITTEVSG